MQIPAVDHGIVVPKLVTAVRWNLGQLSRPLLGAAKFQNSKLSQVFLLVSQVLEPCHRGNNVSVDAQRSRCWFGGRKQPGTDGQEMMRFCMGGASKAGIGAGRQGEASDAEKCVLVSPAAA